MKFIKFIMSTKSVWTFPEDETKKILASPNQLYPVKEIDGQWRGRTINKAHIIETNFDLDAERQWNEKNIKRIEAPDITEEQRLKNIEYLNKMRKNLIKNKVIKI